MGAGPFSEDDLDTLPRLFKFHKQLTLLSQLEGTIHDFSLLYCHHFKMSHVILSRHTFTELFTQASSGEE